MVFFFLKPARISQVSSSSWRRGSSHPSSYLTNAPDLDPAGLKLARGHATKSPTLSAGASGMAEGKRSARNRHLPTNQWPLPQNALQRVHWTKGVERATTQTWRAVSLVSASLERVPMRAAVSVGHVSMYSNVDAGDAIGAPRRRSEAVDCEIGAHTYAPSAVLDVRIKGCIFTLGIASHLFLFYMTTGRRARSLLSHVAGAPTRRVRGTPRLPRGVAAAAEPSLCGRSTRGSQS